MTPNTLRSFAGGLIVATSILGSVYFFGSNGAQSTEKLSEKDMKSALTEKGYVIHTEKEWNEQQAVFEAAQKAAEAKPETPAETQPAAPAENQAGQVVYRTVVNVSDGMTSIDVGRSLEAAKIINISAMDFSKEIENRGVEKYLRPGIFEIQSGMTIDEIIATIFKP
jgi:hypothetical protein